MKNISYFLLAFVSIFMFVACERDEAMVELPDNKLDLLDKMVKVDLPVTNNFTNPFQKSGTTNNFVDRVKEINQSLEAYGLQIEKMEYYSSNEAGNIVFFSDRGNKRLTSDYVPNDPRSLLPGTAVPYIVDGTQLNTASGFNTLNAINSVMNTWDQVTCSDGLTIPNAGVAPFDLGYVSNLLGFGGTEGFYPGVIVHAGVLPFEFFEAVRSGGGSSILGVTFTFSWIEDINNDGKGDVALKEIYYNDYFNWQDAVAAGFGYDFETVSLHEVGHALSQAHFGKLSGTFANGKLHYSPRALMNAGYTGVNRVVEKTDKAGHCSNWANWPNN
ncbi:MAG: hypothetical protein WBN17_04075 [Aureibaculum sp.]|jgi:hypothetical protein